MPKGSEKTPIAPHASVTRFSSIEGRIASNGRDAEQSPDVLYRQGLLFQFKKEYESAISSFEQAYKLYIQEKVFLGAIRCLIELAWLRFNDEISDGIPKANLLFTEAESMIQAHINEPGVNDARARLLHYKGLIKYREGQYGEGLHYFKWAKTFCRPEGIESAKILDSFGIHYDRTGDFYRAIQSLRHSLQIKQNLGLFHEEAITSQILGRLYIAYEEYELGLKYLQTAIQVSETLEDTKRVVSLKNDMIKLFIQMGQIDKAQQLIQELETIPLVPGLEIARGMTLFYKATLYYFAESLDSCQNLLNQEIFPLFKKTRFQKGVAMALRLLGCVRQSCGESTQAIENMGEAIALFKEEKCADELTKTHFELGKLYREMGENKLALASMMEALKLSEQHGLTVLTSYIEDEIYRIDLGKWKEVVHKRTNHERLFEQEHTLLEALSALSEEEQLNAQTKSLVSLLRVGQAMAGERNLDKLLCLIKEETEQALNADRCTVFLYDRENNQLWSKVASGLEGTEEIRFPAHLGLAGYVAKTGETLNIKNAYEDPRFNKEIDKKTGYKTENLLCMPMRNRKQEIIGVFQVLNKQDGPFQKVDEDLLMAISSSAGVAIENAQLATEQKVTFESFIKTLSSTIDARDPITAGHSDRVAEYSLLVGEMMQLTSEEMEALKYASLLHDIGKIGIKEEILMKDGRLTEKEYRHIQKHVYYTYEILKNIRFERHLQKVPEIAAAHHEKVDGTGYFRGLSGHAIPLSGRIMAVSDVFDAITSRRHYRNRMPFDKVLGILKRDSNSHFDGDCIETFLNIRLYRLAEVLLMDKFVELPDGGQRLLQEMDRNITVRQYEEILYTEKMTKREADIHRVFSSLYHHNHISHMD